MRVFSTAMTWSIRRRVALGLGSKSLHESFLNSHTLDNENKSCMKVGKREFT